MRVCYAEANGEFNRQRLEDHGCQVWEAVELFAVARMYGIIDDGEEGASLWNDLIRRGPPHCKHDADNWPQLLAHIQRQARRRGVWSYPPEPLAAIATASKLSSAPQPGLRGKFAAKVRPAAASSAGPGATPPPTTSSACV